MMRVKQSLQNTKYQDVIQEQREEDKEYGGHTSLKVDVDEDQSGTTELYIEKGIHIIIQRYKVARKCSKVSPTRNIKH